MSVAVMSLLLNVVIAGLLVANITYCWVLNNRIKILQDGKSELASLLGYFDEATERASESIVALQAASKKIGENMQSKIDKANFLLDDLASMVEKGNRLAEQLDSDFTGNGAAGRVRARPESNIDDEIGELPYLDKEQERIVEAKLSKEKKSASLEAVLGRVVSRIKPSHLSRDFLQTANRRVAVNVEAEDEFADGSKTPDKSRSKAEQELLEMIRAGIRG